MKTNAIAKLLNKHKLTNSGMESLVDQMLKRPELMKSPDFPAILGAINRLFRDEKRFIAFDKAANPPLAIKKKPEKVPGFNELDGEALEPV